MLWFPRLRLCPALLLILPGLAILSGLAPAWAQEFPEPDDVSVQTASNVNSRYLVESVELSKSITKRISRALRHDIDSLVGRRFDPQSVATLAQRIHREVRAVVQHRVAKGDQPEHVKVIYEAGDRRWDQDAARVSRLSYHQKLGSTAGLQLGFNAGRDNRIEGGIETDADSLLERFSGFNVGFSRDLSDRIRVRAVFESFSSKWNPATELALASRQDVPGIYRQRHRIDPSVTVVLAPGLSLTAGLSFQNFERQYPASRWESANALAATARYRREWATVEGSDLRLDSVYSVRAGAGALGSDYGYVRHYAEAHYAIHSGPHRADVRLAGGATGELSPLFERFTLGDSRTLRGWNKFDVAPLGGTRMIHASLQYTWKRVGAFYDTGSVWDRRTPARERHAAGALLTLNSSLEGPFIAVGFPIRNSNVVPLFILGMNF